MDGPHPGAAFVESLCAEALDSAAVNHRYLRAIREGDFPDIDLALKDFAFQYGVYSGAFVHYVLALTENLSKAEHRQALQANLEEEQGSVHGVDLPPEVLASVIGQPHTLLYRRFQEALGIDAAYRNTAHACHESRLWACEFLKLCKTDEFVGIGAIGIGTELIVSQIYDQILAGLKKHSKLTPIQRVFFDLHSECDEAHANQLLRVAEDLARDRESCEKIAYGARRAIELRVRFWDAMLVRAHSLPASSTTTARNLSAIEN